MLTNTEIIERAKEVLGMTGHGSDTQFSEYLGVTKATVSNWRRRDAVDLLLIRNKMGQSAFLKLFSENEGQNENFSHLSEFEMKSKVIVEEVVLRHLKLKPPIHIIKSVVDLMAGAMEENKTKSLTDWTEEIERLFQIAMNNHQQKK